MRPWWIPAGERMLLALLAVAVLWKGGKGLEMTWLSALFVFSLWLLTWRMMPYVRMTNARRTSSVLWWSIVLFLLWTIFSWITSTTRNYGLDEVMRTATAGMLFLWIVRMRALGYLTMIPSAFARWMGRLAVLASGIGLGIYMLQPVNRMVGTFFDARFHTDYWPNAWAQFLLLTWPIVLWTCLSDSSTTRQRIARLTGLSLIMAALLLSYSRGALIASAGQIVLLCAVLLVRHLRLNGTSLSRQVLRRGIMALVMVVTISGGIFTTSNTLRAVRFPVQSVAEKVTFTAAEGRSSVSERSQFWEQSFVLMLQRPWLGWGPYSFRFVQTALMQDVLATSDHPHNALLKMGMERGMPALLLLLIACVCIALRAWHLAVRARDSMPAFLLVALAGICAHNLIDYNLQFIGILLPVTVMAALLIDEGNNAEAQMQTGMTIFHGRWQIRHLEAWIILPLFFTLLWEGAHLALSSFGRHAEVQGQTAAAEYWYERSRTALFPRDLELSRARILMEWNDYAGAAAALDTYGSSNAEDARLWLLRGELALRQRATHAAVRALEQAYQRGALTTVAIPHLYATAWTQSKSGDELSAQREAFINIFEQYATAIMRNTHYIALSHNPEELLAFAKLLDRHFSDDSQDFITVAKTALRHAEEERAVYASRATGLLW